MSQIEKEFLAEECAVDESEVYNSYPIEKNEVLLFTSPFDQKILDRTKIRTARKRDKSGEFTIKGEQFKAEFEVALTIPAFISLFDNDHYFPDEFGFESYPEMWAYYGLYFQNGDLVVVHKIIDLESE
ncbi:hypothetical protein [Sulfuricurvum sp.]|uniref:hypothetical protein n=1 Tax=Sulfuricurvum sp. TaxID=2025608 RepID=UPI0026266372|nr:hypothetical protein [Sulfuricurvum sp.]MDD2267666.1 hypothetical protein [Sulfuricurvum sp.]MDD2784245.1 hypothetical protein [Sulfuricurvum sp.]